MAIITRTGYPPDAGEVSSRTTAPADLRIGRDGEMVDPGGDRMLCAGDWTAQAMCRSKTAIFFAPPGEREGRRRRREALACAYCAVCPVKASCKQAGRQGREHGIWGGENDEERAAAGHAPRSPHRRAVAEAARQSRIDRMIAQPTTSGADTTEGVASRADDGDEVTSPLEGHLSE